MEPELVVLSLAKNCAGTVPAFLGMLSSLKASGTCYAAYIGENDSMDGTDALLRTAEERGQLTVVSTAFLSEVGNRLHRMALGRQRLKDVFDMSGLRPRWVCVADVDNVMEHPPAIDAIRGALTKLERSDLFAVAATSRPLYYDLIAYEDDLSSFEFLDERIKAERRNPLFYYRFFSQNVYPYQRKLTSERELLATSAFNGFCIYKAEAYARGSYLDKDFRRCEHLTFNRLVAQETGMKILVDPGLVLSTPTDHIEMSFVSFVWNRIGKALGSRR